MKHTTLFALLCFFLVVLLSGLPGPALGQSVGGESTPAKELVASGKIDINEANAAMLLQVPGIGPKTAEAIVDFRKRNGNFTTVDQLTEIKGIGSKKLEKIRPYLRPL